MADFRYINLDIRVFPDAGGQLRVVYTYPGVEPATGLERPYQSPVGYVAALTGGPADTRQGRRRAGGGQSHDGPANLQALYTAGAALYAALIPKETESLLSLAETLETPVRVRVRIDLTQTPELCAIPWEALYRKASNKLLATTVNTTVVRLLDPDDQQQQTPVEGPLRVLVAVAIPDRDLAGDVEVANIHRRIDQLARINIQATRLEFQELHQTNRKTLRQKVWEFKPHVIHYIGHGEFRDGRGFLLLHDQADPQQPDPVDAAALADLWQNDRPRLVVLNTCQSATADVRDPFAGSAQSLIRSNIPYVVAMQSPISDDAAITFAEEFYSVLVAGEPIDAAVSRGRNAIRLMQDQGAQTELITPVLYCSGPIAPLVAPNVRADAPAVVAPAPLPAPPLSPPPLAPPAPPADRDLSIRIPKVAAGAAAAVLLLLSGALTTLVVMRGPAPSAPPNEPVQVAPGEEPIEAVPAPAGDDGFGHGAEGGGIDEIIVRGSPRPRLQPTPVATSRRPVQAAAPLPEPIEAQWEAPEPDSALIAANVEYEARLEQERAAYEVAQGRWEADTLAAQAAHEAERERWEAAAAAWSEGRREERSIVGRLICMSRLCWARPSALVAGPQAVSQNELTISLPEVVDGPMNLAQRDSLMALAESARLAQASIELRAADVSAAERARRVLILSGLPDGAVSIGADVFEGEAQARASFHSDLWRAPVLPASYFFESGSAEPLRPDALPEATKTWLAERPTDVGLRVVGHADATGADDYNDALAVARAGAVVDILVAAGTPRERITLLGAGARAATYPQADAFARRVDVEPMLLGAESVSLPPDGTMAEAEGVLDHAAAFLLAHTEVGVALRFRSARGPLAGDDGAPGQSEIKRVRAGLAERGVDPERIGLAPPLIGLVPAGGGVASDEPDRVDLTLTF